MLEETRVELIIGFPIATRLQPAGRRTSGGSGRGSRNVGAPRSYGGDRISDSESQRASTMNAPVSLPYGLHGASGPFPGARHEARRRVRGRQYASFAGIVNGGHAFFDSLVTRGLPLQSRASSTALGCITLHARDLYRAIGDGCAGKRKKSLSRPVMRTLLTLTH